MAIEGKRVTGAAGRTLAANMVALRRYHDLDQPALARRTAEHGRPLTVSAISLIERCNRRVDADDLVVLAAALNVDPAALLLPHTLSGEIEIVSGLKVPARAAWEWARGLRPLPSAAGDDSDRAYSRAMDYARFSSPPGLIFAETIIKNVRAQPGGRRQGTGRTR
jgi:transcriptional regulator with XRE-family HTH domain